MNQLQYIVRYSLTFIAVILFSGCATSYTPLTMEAKSNIQSSEIILDLKQQELYAEIEKADSSAASAQFGLLGALIGTVVDSTINSSRSETAETMVAPIRNSMVDYNFGQALEDTLAVELKSLSFLNIQHISQVHSQDSEESTKLIENSQADVVLTLNTVYYLTPNFRTLKIISNIKAHPNTDILKVIVKKTDSNSDIPLLYQNSFTYEYSLKTSTSTLDEAVNNWAENNGRLIRKAVNQGVAELAKMIAYDLNVSESGNNDTKPAKTEKTKYGNRSGILVLDDNQYVILRLEDGSLYSYQKM